MTDFKAIKGFNVKSLATDPLTGGGAAGGTWAGGGNLNTARQSGAGLGIQAASLFVAGETGSILGIVENYNGTAWTEVGDINTARKANAASGTTAAGLTFGGASGPPAAEQANTEVWNGSGWT